MKKVISLIIAIILVVASNIGVMADNTEFIDYCKENYSIVDIQGETKVSVNGLDKLWDDRSVVSEDELTEVQNYNNENEDKMYYAINLKAANHGLGIYTVEHDSSTGEEKHHILPTDAVAQDVAFSKIFNDNVNAYISIEKADSVWCYVSLEKHLIKGNNEEVVGTVLSSQESYTITFEIPSYYKGSEDLKLAKLSDGQVTYFDGVDSNAETYTITTNGSAAYVFAGTRVQTGDSDVVTEPAIGDVDPVPTTEPQDEVTPTHEVSDPTNPTPDDTGNNSGKTTAPQTSDTNEILLFSLMTLIAVLGLIYSKNKCRA